MTLPFFEEYLPEKQDVGRMVPNAFKINEIVTLQPDMWKYFDWLKSTGINMDIWTREADICRHRSGYRCSWRNSLRSMLRNDAKRRILAGLECPSEIFGESLNCEFYKDIKSEGVKIYERLETDNEIIERKYKNMLGVDVKIQMPGKYWRHLDWIVSYIGGDAQEWVAYADCEKAKLKKPLSEVLMDCLYVHEEKSFFDNGKWADVEFPLFISPIGYIDLRVPPFSKRELIDSKGKTVLVKMPDSYWNYFDWLETQDINLKQWVKDTDIKRLEAKYPREIGSEMIIELQREQKRRK